MLRTFQMTLVSQEVYFQCCDSMNFAIHLPMYLLIDGLNLLIDGLKLENGILKEVGSNTS